MTKNIYYISGLGADERVFTFLRLKNVQETYIKWLPPNKAETLSTYSKRLIDQIDTSRKVILIGVSFGGLVAQEIARHIKVETLFIISSVKSFKEYGLELKLASYSKIYKLVPAFILKWANRLTANYYFGVQSKEESILLKDIINDTDNRFMVWAIHEIMNWKKISNTTIDIIHIQGTNDKIFTNRKLKDVIWIKGGGHFMIVNRADELSEIIDSKLN